jgi:hypothetical protein
MRDGLPPGKLLRPLLAERQLGRLRLFVNGEKSDRRPSNTVVADGSAGSAPDGRWTVDVWAPLEGRNINRRPRGTSDVANQAAPA